MTQRKKDAADKAAAVARHTAVIASFKADVCDHWEEIDPSEEQDWYSLSMGYFIAKGVNFDDTIWLALYVRYDMHYWEAGKT